jgi:hypothetical protein
MCIPCSCHRICRELGVHIKTAYRWCWWFRNVALSYEVNWVSRTGYTVLTVVKDFTIATVQKASEIAVKTGSTLYTDSAKSYHALVGYKHDSVNHSQKEYARGFGVSGASAPERSSRESSRELFFSVTSFLGIVSWN